MFKKVNEITLSIIVGTFAVGIFLLFLWTLPVSSSENWKPSATFEQRDSVFYLRGPYNYAHYKRNNEDYRMGAVAHWAHGAAHDMLLNSTLDTASKDDKKFYDKGLDYLNDPPRTEPHQDYVGPVFARLAWQAVQVIDWTHMLHEQLYDIMADKDIPMADKKKWIDKAVDYYLSQPSTAFSPAPLDIVLERVGIDTIMPPIRTYFTNYPDTKGLFFAFHWWHPAIYEVQLIHGDNQEKPILEVLDKMRNEVVPNPPNRMLLSREIMPRFAKLTPEAANIFDNLHMFHGIVYGILSSPDIKDKRAALYRVIEAMRVKPGDREIAETFVYPYTHPDIDPTVYSEWMWEGPGEMGRIMGHDRKGMEHEDTEHDMKMKKGNMEMEHKHEK